MPYTQYPHLLKNLKRRIINIMNSFFHEKYEYTILENKTLKEIEEETPNIILSLPDTRSGRWAKYASLKGAQAGLHIIYSINFGYNISSIVTDKGIDAGSDIFFRQTLDDEIIKIYEHNKEKYPDEIDLLKHFFNDTLQFYKTQAQKYEKNAYRIPLKISQSDMQTLKSTAPTIKKAIFKLMDQKKNNTNESKIPYEEISVRTEINLTLTEKERFDSLDGDSPSKKVIQLIRK